MKVSMEQNTRELLAKLKELAQNGGAGYFGVADLAPATGFIREQGGDIPASFPTAVSVGIAIPAGLVEMLAVADTDPGVLVTYDRYVYQVCNLMLDQLTFNLAREIEGAGYRAMPVAASLRVPGRPFAGVFSHKLAAHLAGMGWIGKSCLLITPRDGPRVRWGTVLTDAPLPAGKPMERGCRGCTKCVEACPAGAVKGRNFNPAEPRSARLNVEKCEEYRNNMAASKGVRTCGKCLAVCPYSKRKGKVSV
ncbi:4Fe-4S double cluster binding domain-containing protein [Desulfofundulus thermosubterraneus]|uniref:4Fe-4S double cluster binding domain-containing protein n=1 Tax=Desulfofundulus thermosubterraneus DSM 16057 TaxID=1121432 RepID=A0A1M6F0D3_9FIRM|nr:4Fe-4S double cluster binding domain-containing protein [Desulfofundulus thermosubterraneus]SHI91115.1 4Fe-4S double cluster binding domain-containing protein [Desulfofundulus thermosubterraneus DSM 16057]